MPGRKIASRSQILFPVDFSPRCEQAAPAVRLWSAELKSQPVLLHVVPFPATPEMDYSGPLYLAFLTELHKAAAVRLRDFASRHFEGVAIQRLVKDGNPAAAICSWAGRRNPRLIMMPTHGYGMFRQFLAGSVTAQVLHDAVCPVWTAAHADTTPVRPKPPRLILCAVDRVPAAVPLIRWSARLASQCGASLQLVHVIPAVDETSQNRGEKEVRRFWTAKARQELAPLLEAAGQNDILLRGGSIADTLAETVRRQGADLLVIGRGRLPKRLGRLRTHSMSIVCKSPCAVISV